MRLFCIGMGYVCEALGGHLLERGIFVGGTTRDGDKCERLGGRGFSMFRLTAGEEAGADFWEALGGATHILCSVPPDDLGGDFVLGMLSGWGG
ncbi:MAG: hypothetical protein OD811_04535, partial [Alphaproteobacteria bacterium]